MQAGSSFAFATGRQVADVSRFRGYALNHQRATEWRQRVRGHPHIAPSYIAGTSPANHYALPPLPWVVSVDNALNNPHAVKDANHVRQ